MEDALLLSRKRRMDFMFYLFLLLFFLFGTTIHVRSEKQIPPKHKTKITRSAPLAVLPERIQMARPKVSVHPAK